jgi:hypothetical protein
MLATAAAEKTPFGIIGDGHRPVQVAVHLVTSCTESQLMATLASLRATPFNAGRANNMHSTHLSATSECNWLILPEIYACLKD